MNTKSELMCQMPEGSQELSRRNFLKLGIGVLGVIATLEAGAAGVLFLQSRGQEEGFGGLITAGSIDDFPLGSVIEFPEHRFFLIRSHDGGFLAVHNRCTHLGCTVFWDPEQNHFVCPCHASSFDFYGDFESPPVPRPLDTLSIQIKEDMVVQVDTSRLQQRENFMPEQLVYA
ncbi:MAG: Rieske (2Fe-2S) protein [Chloroflexi bacterium]|nr:Rieske (2Fe-2S) protein [Chloroflexota bacterium]